MPASVWKWGGAVGAQVSMGDEQHAALPPSGAERGCQKYREVGEGGEGGRSERDAAMLSSFRPVVLRREGGRSLENGLQGGRRWMRDWRVAVVALAALVSACALVSLYRGDHASARLGEGGKPGLGIAYSREGEDGGRGMAFELVEQKLDEAIVPDDGEAARARGWSRAQALALRDPSAAAAQRLSLKAPRFGVLKKQMQHLGVLRQRLSRMLETERHSIVNTQPTAAQQLAVADKPRAASASQNLFAWPSSTAGASNDALSGQTTSNLYILEPLSRAAAPHQQLQGQASAGGRRAMPPIVPVDKSTRLWDFPDIQKWQVIQSRANFWPEMAKINAQHQYESEPFSWPEPSADTSSEHPWVRAASKSVGPKVHVTGSAADNGLPEVGNPAFDWPQPQGDISAFPPSATATPQYVKSGGLLKRGDIMAKTRPWILWSASCSLYLCPLDTPKKERAYAWRYCMNHFYTNAEKRYCFAAILAPPKPPPSCPPLEPPAHGRVVVPPDSEEGFTPGRVKVGFPVDIVCDEGYHIAGNAEPKCLADGSYDHPGKCVEVVCPPYDPPAHGSVQPTTSTEVGQHVNISCETTYDVAGDPSPVCQPDGTYSAGATCEPVLCPPYTPPEHGSVTPAGPVAMGSSVHISCDPGYEAAQPNAVDVVCDGSWGSGSSCVPIMCPPYAPGEHAVASDAKSHTVGETVSVHCEAGFEPVVEKETEAQKRKAGLMGGRGRSSAQTIHANIDTIVVNGVKTVSGIVCGDDRMYHPPMHCQETLLAAQPIVPKCVPYDAPDHGSVKPAGEVAVGDCVEIICDIDYQLPPGVAPQACCVQGPSWDPPTPPQCIPLQQCPPFPPPKHGSVDPRGITHVGDQVSITCDAGYRLCKDCSDVATCTGTTYDIGPVTCVAIPQCAPYPATACMTVTPSGNVTEGGCVHIECKPGCEFDSSGNKENPCCVFDIVSGELGWEEGKRCLPPQHECVVCNDIAICPHCFIGPKVAPSKRREVHFD